MPDYTYNYRASECPAPQEPLSPLYLGASPPTPTTADSITAGGGTAGAQSLPTKFSRNAVRIDLQGRYGGAGIWWGLDLEDGGGLTGRIANGQVGLDAGAEVKQDAGYTTLALTGSTVNRVWISRGGTLSKVTADSASPLDPPDDSTLWHYLGAFLMTDAGIVGRDRSGVIFANQGGLLWRRTADTEEPDDTPPESVRLLTRTQGGLYLWDGTQHDRIDSALAETLETSFTAQEQSLLDLERRFRLLLRNLTRTFEGLEENLKAGLDYDYERAAALAD